MDFLVFQSNQWCFLNERFRLEVEFICNLLVENLKWQSFWIYFNEYYIYKLAEVTNSVTLEKGPE